MLGENCFIVGWFELCRCEPFQVCPEILCHGRQAEKGETRKHCLYSPGSLWEHSCPATGSLRCPAVCPSVHSSIHHSAEPLFPDESPGQPCWTWAQGQGLIFLHQTRPEKEQNLQNAQPDLTPTQSIPSHLWQTAANLLLLFPRSGNSQWTSPEALHGAHCTITLCLEPQQSHQVTSAGTTCVQPQGNFSCAPHRNLVLSERQKSLQILILQECCGASVISHFWQAYVNSIQGGRTSSEQRNPSSLPLV